jgi:transcriptional regulator with XRE-family HTH domain
MLQKEAIYQRINDTRENLKLSWQGLADLIGSSRMGLYKSWNNQTMTIETMVLVCNAMDMDGSDLFDANDNQGPKKRTVPACVADIRTLCAEIERLSAGSKK